MDYTEDKKGYKVDNIEPNEDNKKNEEKNNYLEFKYDYEEKNIL